MAQSLVIDDPATGKPVGTYRCTEPDEVHNSVRRARHAAPSWARTAPADRAAAVARAADGLAAAADELAALTTSEMGKPVGDALGGVLAGIGTLRQYAELGPVHRGRVLQGRWDATDLMVPQPRGVAGVLTPWNDPVAVPCGLLGAALVTGNTVVFKPSERTPGTGVRLAQLLQEQLPEGVLELVLGAADVGRLVSGSPGLDVLAHVGSTSTGRELAATAARTGAKVLLENGGKDPLIVDETVDPEWAADQAALGAFANAGQICTSVERVHVVASVAQAFTDALVDRAKALRQGPGADPRTELGPLVDQRHRDLVHGHVTAAVAAGAELRTGGFVPAGPGCFYPPTVLTACEPGMAVMTEETFGPVAPIQVVTDFDAALAEAARGPFGLAATVLTGDLARAQRAWRELPVGTVKINAVFGGAPGGAAQPRGASGTGFGYGPELLDEFTTTKVVHLEPAPALRLASDDARVEG